MKDRSSSSPKKLLIAVTVGELGGAQKYVHDIATNLTESYNIAVATGTGDETLIEWMRQKGITVYPLLYMQRALVRGWFPALDDFRALVELWRLCRIHHFDVVHLNSSKMGFLGAIAARLARTPKVVFTAHGWVFNEPKEIRPYKSLWIFVSRLAAYFQDFIICVSEYDRMQALHYRIAPPRKLFTVRTGIDAKTISFLSRDSARAWTRAQFGIPESAFIVGTVANTYYAKDLTTMIEAFSKIPPVAHLVIIGGEGSQPREELEDRIGDAGLMGRVHLAGAVVHAAQYLPGFDAYLVTSTKEGLPFSILEAMAAGVPIIATPVGGLEEVLFPSSEKVPYGQAIPVGDPTAVSRAIETLMSDGKQREFLAKQAKKRVGTLTLSEMLERTKWIYEF